MKQQAKDGKRILITGSSGCGKTSLISAIVQNKVNNLGVNGERLLIWDIDDQLTDHFKAQKCMNISELPYIQVFNSYLLDTKKSFKVGYVSKKARADFDKFCKLAFHIGRIAPVTVIVEELADVSTVGKASDAWGVLVRRGRKYGINIIATTQRVAEIDKTIVSNSSDLIVFRHQFTRDIKFLTDMLKTNDIPDTNLKFAWFKTNEHMARADYNLTPGAMPKIKKI